MTRFRASAVSRFVAVLFLVAVCSHSPLAQQASSSNAVVPTLVQFSGVLTGSNGRPLTGITGITFSLYADQQGGAPLWLETQNVQPDKNGNYSVQLGSTTNQGLPASLFASGQARWLEVQPQGQEPQPRIMLMSVPYALKAGDAQTIGGLPPSAFVMAPRSVAASGSAAGGLSTAAPSTPAGINAATIAGGGTKDYVPLWLTSSKLGTSKIFQSTAGDIGIETTTPAANLDVNGTVNATTSYNLGGDMFAYGSSSNKNAFLGFAGNSTTTGGSNTGSGMGALAADTTGGGNTASGYNALLNNTSGAFNTATGDTSLAGNVTGAYNSALGYLAGQAVGGASFYNNNTFIGAGAAGTTSSGLLTNATAVGSNAEVAESNALVLGAITGVNGGTSVNVGIGTTTPQFPLDVNGTINTANGFSLGGTLFAFGSNSYKNAFLGFAGSMSVNQTVFFDTAVGLDALSRDSSGYNTAIGALALQYNTAGTDNTAFGFSALQGDTAGSYNTGFGNQAMEDNSEGNYNTAIGYQALFTNSGSYNTGSGESAGWTVDNSLLTGSNDTFLGASAFLSTGSLSNATAIGANAVVGENNALVLGSINGVNNATASVSVGIGTTKPAYTLDVSLGDMIVRGAKNFVQSGEVADLYVGDGNHEVQATNAQGIGLSAFNSTNQLFVTDNLGTGTGCYQGYVGIGTMCPDNLLSVNGSADKPGGGSWGTFSDRRLKTLHGSFNAGLR